MLRSRDICEIHRFQNLWHHHGHCCIMEVTLSLILSTIKIKFHQILVCCMKNISNMFLTQCLRLDTSSRPFYDFIEMTIERDVAIFSSWQSPFLIVPYSPFQNYEALESWHIWVLNNWSKLLNWKWPGT